jgi:predicted ester cyclase
MVKQLVPDLSAEIHNIYASGDLVVAEVTWSGTHTATTFFDMPATDRAFTLHSLNVRRFEDGKVVEDWDVLDDLVFLQSIGYLPSLSEIQANGPLD